MIRFLWSLIGVLGLVGAGAAAEPEKKSAAAPPDADVRALSAKVDQFLAARWSAEKVVPAPTADDAEFLRRVYLDVVGRIPSAAEARAFLKDPDLEKRRKLIDRLLDGPGYVRNFATIYKSLLIPEAANDVVLQIYFVPSFEAWLRKQFARNVPYDQMVRELLTAPVGGGGRPYAGSMGQPTEPTPAAFYLAKQVKPENLGASTARVFLGTRLECAQCHNHPFAHWTRDQFWELAAFYAGFDKPQTGDFNAFMAVQETPGKRELKVAGTTKVVKAAFLDGKQPTWKDKSSPRATLAEWVTSPYNSYFARAAVNRIWAHFFGTGLVEPVDDLSEANPPSHPELLTELAREFAAHRFDMKFLVRALTNTRAYQLASATTHPSQRDPHRFSRMALKGLTGEQLYDSLAQATGVRNEGDENPFAFRTSARQDFLKKFAAQEKRTEYHTSILQALSLMNGSFIAEATSLEKSNTLAAVADAPFLDMPAKIEGLFLATLSRPPKPAEAERFLKYVRQGGVKNNPKAALCDLYWALLNSSEFLMNH